MMKLADLKQRQVLVVGAGVTGTSVMRYLHRHGVRFDLAEQQPVSDECRQYLQESQVLPTFDATRFSTYDIIVLSPGVPRAHPAIVRALRAGVRVIGDIELYAAALQVPVIAVTGSNGKSTVVSWLAHVLEHCGVKVALCGNIGRPALDALDENVSIHVLELSSYQLESTDSLAPLVACVLNVSDDHLDRYASMDDYAATKRRIYSLATHCVFNQDDERTWRDAGPASDGSVRRFALQAVDGVDYHINGARDSASSGTDNITLYHHGTALLSADSLSMPGLHNVANALAILAMLEPLSLQGEDVLNALRSFGGLPHRTELVADRQGVRWFNDSKGTNVDACIKAIQAMPGPVILIAGGQGKGANFQVLRPSVERHVKLLLLMGEDSAALEEALSGLAPIHIVESLSAGVSLAASHARSGDCVLLSPACASFDMFHDFEDRGDRFRDAVEALAA